MIIDRENRIINISIEIPEFIYRFFGNEEKVIKERVMSKEEAYTRLCDTPIEELECYVDKNNTVIAIVGEVNFESLRGSKNITIMPVIEFLKYIDKTIIENVKARQNFFENELYFHNLLNNEDFKFCSKIMDCRYFNKEYILTLEDSSKAIVSEKNVRTNYRTFKLSIHDFFNNRLYLWDDDNIKLFANISQYYDYRLKSDSDN